MSNDNKHISKTESREQFNETLKVLFNLGCFCRVLEEKVFSKSVKSDGMLTEAQFRVLHVIKKFNITSIPELVKVAGISESTISTTVSKLCEIGIIVKEKSEAEDGRKMHFYITERGEETLERMFSKIILNFKEYYNSLDDNTKIVFYESMEKLYKVFSSIS